MQTSSHATLAKLGRMTDAQYAIVEARTTEIVRESGCLWSDALDRVANEYVWTDLGRLVRVPDGRGDDA